MISALVMMLVAQPAPSEHVVVLTNPSGDITPRQARLFEAHLKLELAKHDRLAVSEGATPPKSADECVKEPTCLSQLAASAGADTVVFARSARFSDDSVLSMKRLRISTGEIEQTSVRQLTGGNGQEMLAAIGPMVAELFPQEPLRPGAVQGVQRDDVVRWSPPPVPQAVFWSGVGATVVSGALIGLFAVQKHDAVRDFDNDLNAGSGQAASGEQVVNDQNRAHSKTHDVNIMIGVTAVVGVTTAILGYFTDWDKGRDEALLHAAP